MNYAQGTNVTPDTEHCSPTRGCSYAVVTATAWSPAYLNLAAYAATDGLGTGVPALDVNSGYGQITVSRFRGD